MHLQALECVVLLRMHVKSLILNPSIKLKLSGNLYLQNYLHREEDMLW